MKEYNLKINDKKYTVVIKNVSDDSVLAEVNGKKHVVQIDTINNLTDAMEAQSNTPTASLPSSPSSSPAPPHASSATPTKAGTVITPIPGQVISISVSIGEQVSTGQKLLVLEAMKLENSITATMDGTVSEILVAEGDVVNQSQPLIVLT